MLLLILCEMTSHGQPYKEDAWKGSYMWHGDIGTCSWRFWFIKPNCNVWNGLSLRFCHGHGINWLNRIVGVVLLIGYWKDGNQLMIATNKRSVIWMGMNDADVSVNKSTSLVTIFGDNDSHSEINWHRLISALRSRKNNDRFAIAKEVPQNGLIDNVRSIVGKSHESGLLALPKAPYKCHPVWLVCEDREL